MKVLVNSLVGVADLHVGCQLGLCPAKAVKLDEGGHYRPNSFQRKLWRWWREFWTEWVPAVTRGEPFGVVVNGDAIDGRHHGAVTQWTQNLATQVRVAYDILAPIVDVCEGRFWLIRGTTAHTGPSSESEEALAKALGAIPNKEGQYARYELWKYIGAHKEILTHWLHHIGTTSSASYESTAVHKELVEAYQEAGRWGHRPPDMIIRAHRHRDFQTQVRTARGRGIAMVLAGWQGKTPFTYSTAIARQAVPQFGGRLLRLSEEGEMYTREKVWELQRAAPE